MWHRCGLRRFVRRGAVMIRSLGLGRGIGERGGTVLAKYRARQRIMTTPVRRSWGICLRGVMMAQMMQATA